MHNEDRLLKDAKEFGLHAEAVLSGLEITAYRKWLRDEEHLPQ